MNTKQTIYYVLQDGRIAFMKYERAESYAKKFDCVITDGEGNVLADFTGQQKFLF
jgi:hypothetical protein